MSSLFELENNLSASFFFPGDFQFNRWPSVRIFHQQGLTAHLKCAVRNLLIYQWILGRILRQTQLVRRSDFFARCPSFAVCALLRLLLNHEWNSQFSRGVQTSLGIVVTACLACLPFAWIYWLHVYILQRWNTFQHSSLCIYCADISANLTALHRALFLDATNCKSVLWMLKVQS